MAVAHWATAIWEDSANTSFLRAGLSSGSADLDLSKLIWVAYTVHHLVAGCAFALVLYLQACSGIAIFGLVFELPVLLMNHREFATFADKPPSWFRDQARVEKFWNRLDLLFKVGRYGPALVYIYSLCFWWDDLERLSYLESTVYHSMAIFFTILNWGLSLSLLAAWRHKDIRGSMSEEDAAAEEAHMRALDEEVEEELGESRGGTHVNSASCVQLKTHTTPLQKISEEYFKLHMGPGNEQGKIFLKIDSVGYDVTDFLGKHPGGDSVLREYSGADASEAFHKARHSMHAKMMMQRYCVGAIIQEPKAYRIYEHPDQLQQIFWEGTRLALGYLPVAILLPRTAVGGFGALAISSEASFGEMLCPGLLLTMWSGWNFLLVLLGTRTFRPRMNSNTLLTCVGLIMMLCGFSLGRMPQPEGVSPTAPTGIELGIVLIFLIEDVAELVTKGTSHWSWRMLIGAVAVGAGLMLRGLPTLLRLTQVPWIAAFLFASGLCLMVRQIDDRRSGDDVKMDILHGIALAGPMAGTGMIYLYYNSPLVAAAVQELCGSSWFWIGTLQANSASALIGTAFVTNSAYMCSPPWSARAVAIIFGMGSGFAGGIFNWRWLSWVAWTAETSSLGARQESRIDAAGRAGHFHEVPEYQIGSRAFWDLFRTGIGTWAWLLVLKPVRHIVNFILPEELAMYGSPIPIFDLGEDVDLGVAAYFAPEAVLQCHRPESQLPPEYFVCNVGHVDMRAAGGMSDLQKTMNTLRDTWKEFRQPQVKGLVANMVCFFPRIQGTTFAKEINLSCWQSPEDAQEWYAKSPAHGEIMRQHGNGQLKTFGNLLASLKPHGPIRHQDRCSACARLVESDQVGEKAPRRCKTCGGKGFGYPWF